MTDVILSKILIEDLNILKDLVEIIIEYFLFCLKYIENTNYDDKFSKYINDHCTNQKNNINTLIKKKAEQYVLGNDKLFIITNDILEIYTNNIIRIPIKKLNIRDGYSLTYLNNNIFICNKYNSVIRCINIHNYKTKLWDINDKIGRYSGCLSIYSHDNKIYVAIYKRKTIKKDPKFNFYVNTYDDSGTLIQNYCFPEEYSNINNISLIINDDIIFVKLEKSFSFVKFYHTFINTSQIYDKSFHLFHEITMPPILLYTYSFMLSLNNSFGAITTNNGIIILFHNKFHIYEYSKFNRKKDFIKYVSN